jgi:hypothetical protein
LNQIEQPLKLALTTTWLWFITLYSIENCVNVTVKYTGTVQYSIARQEPNAAIPFFFHGAGVQFFSCSVFKDSLLLKKTKLGCSTP